MLDALIRDMVEHGLASVGHIKFRGNANACLKFIQLMVETALYKPDAEQLNEMTQRMVRDGGTSN